MQHGRPDKIQLNTIQPTSDGGPKFCGQPMAGGSFNPPLWTMNIIGLENTLDLTAGGNIVGDLQTTSYNNNVE